MKIRISDIFVFLAVVVLIGVISAAIIKPDEFSTVETFLHYLNLAGLAIVISFSILIGISGIRLKKMLWWSVSAVLLGILVMLTYIIGSAHKYNLFNGLIADDVHKINEIMSDKDLWSSDRDRLCRYGLSLIKSIYYLKGEIIDLSDCEVSFSPSDSEETTRAYVVSIENNAKRARNTSVLFFAGLMLAVIGGLIFPIRLIKKYELLKFYPKSKDSRHA